MSLADLGREQRAKALSPDPHRLGADPMSRSSSRSSTFLRESGKRTPIIAARRITSRLVQEFPKGLRGVMPRREPAPCPAQVASL
jgi:hypothetical protein